MKSPIAKIVVALAIIAGLGVNGVFAQQTSRKKKLRRGDPGRAAVGQDRGRVRVPRHAGAHLPAAAERRREHHRHRARLRHQPRQRAGARDLVSRSPRRSSTTSTSSAARCTRPGR